MSSKRSYDLLVDIRRSRVSFLQWKWRLNLLKIYSNKKGSKCWANKRINFASCYYFRKIKTWSRSDRINLFRTLYDYGWRTVASYTFTALLCNYKWRFLNWIMDAKLKMINIFIQRDVFLLTIIFPYQDHDHKNK